MFEQGSREKLTCLVYSGWNANGCFQGSAAGQGKGKPLDILLHTPFFVMVTVGVECGITGPTGVDGEQVWTVVVDGL